MIISMISLSRKILGQSVAAWELKQACQILGVYIDIYIYIYIERERERESERERE